MTRVEKDELFYSTHADKIPSVCQVTYETLLFRWFGDERIQNSTQYMFVFPRRTTCKCLPLENTYFLGQLYVNQFVGSVINI